MLETIDAAIALGYADSGSADSGGARGGDAGSGIADGRLAGGGIAGHGEVVGGVRAAALQNGVEAVSGHSGHLKINCVVLGGVNDDELPAFARFAAERPLDVRFIEYMPFGGNAWSEAKLVSAAEMRRRLLDSGIALRPVDTHAHDTARSFELVGGKGRLSFISSMTEHFCSGCNRVRVTADGNLKVCLFGQRELSLRDALRQGASTAELQALIHAALGRKHARHAGMHEIARQAVRPMTTIGG